MTLFCCPGARKRVSRDDHFELPTASHTTRKEELAIAVLASRYLPTPATNVEHPILPGVFPFIIQMKVYETNVRRTVKRVIRGEGRWFGFVTKVAGENGGIERVFLQVDGEKLKRVLRRKKGDGTWLRRCGNAIEYACQQKGHFGKQWSFYVWRWGADGLAGEVPGMAWMGEDSEGEGEGGEEVGAAVFVGEEIDSEDIKAFLRESDGLRAALSRENMAAAIAPSLPSLAAPITPVKSGFSKMKTAESSMLTPPPSSLRPTTDKNTADVSGSTREDSIRLLGTF